MNRTDSAPATLPGATPAAAIPAATPAAPIGARRSGIAFIIAALACFGALDTSSKVAAAVVPVLMAVWVRYLVQTVVTAAVLWPREGTRLLRTRRPLLQVGRALLLISANALAFLSLRYMQVAEFTAIVMLTPLLLTVVAAWALHERVSWLRWLCVSAGFVGTLIVMRPGRELFGVVMLLPLLLVVANTAFQVVTSRLAKTDRPGTIHFYSGLTGLTLTSVALPFAWQPQEPAMWLLMGLMGVLGTLGHFLLIVAYTRTPVAVLTPYQYLQILFAAIGGWVVFGHVPDEWSLVGIALIGAGGVFGTWITGRELLAQRRSIDAQSSIDAIAVSDER
jgi:drug/metabolite transporter (DMT)-like permease